MVLRPVTFLALRAIALVHAPEALPAIEREPERGRKK
jgi:hypothetical protein